VKQTYEPDRLADVDYNGDNEESGFVGDYVVRYNTEIAQYGNAHFGSIARPLIVTVRERRSLD
jgi:hypothetical protein